MKRLLFIPAVILFLNMGCSEAKKETEEPEQTFISDHSQLEEAKAISRKIYAGIKKVENEQLTTSEFQTYAKPLQRQLNTLIINMDEQEAKELDRYKNELMEGLPSSEVAQQK